jgi:hypothetical protein
VEKAAAVKYVTALELTVAADATIVAEVPVMEIP